MDGDIEGLNEYRPVGILISDIFKECLAHVYGKDLDRMIEKCLGLFRAQATVISGIGIGMSSEETDVAFRHRASLLAPTLDSFATKIRTSCHHRWASYQGLFESYEYCSTCNERKS